MTTKSVKEKEKGPSEVEIKTTPAGNKKTAKADDDSAVNDARNIRPKELFDSSKYDAMSDMAKGADLKTDSVDVLANAPPEQRLKTEDIPGEATITSSTTATSAEKNNLSTSGGGDNLPKITPMVVEERARTIREVNQEINEFYRSVQNTSGNNNNNNDRFVLYLNLMLSIENAAIERLHARIQQSILPQTREQLIHHLQESREQKNRLISLIQKLGGQPTNERAELLGYAPPKSLADALQALAATPAEQELKTMESDALIEHAEVIGYNTLIQMAEKMKIGEAIPPLRQNLKEEEDMTARIRAYMPSNFVQLWSKIEEQGQ